MKSMIWMTAVSVSGGVHAMSEETLPPLLNNEPPRTVESLWAGYDPRAEPLDVEVLKEWEEDGVVLQVLRYRVGVFKGRKAMMAAVYGYPKGATNLPGLVQIHGGGQFAHYQACLTNAKRGYATISIAWAGRLSAPGYHVDPEVVKLFWDGATNNPQYRVTTDWGALDGYHAPFRFKHGFSSAAPHEHTLDAVESPRNDSWFLCAMGGRRALTFLEQRPEVDGDRLGVYGHSMGGKLTVMVAGTDDRVKAAAPSCGGISHLEEHNPLIRATICDDNYLKNIGCPTAFLSPVNDFHGRIEDLKPATLLIRTDLWRAACAPHHNHQDNAESEVMTQLWMDQHLKGAFSFPDTPTIELDLANGSGTPSCTVRADTSRPIASIDVYYTQQAEPEGGSDGRQHTIARFWHYAPATESGDAWTARLPLHTADAPLWVYVNIVYALDEPVSGVGYYYGAYDAEAFNLSSLMQVATADELKAAGIVSELKPLLLIEDFEGEWEKEWFTYRPREWARNTHKVYDMQWKAPAGAKLAIGIRSEEPNRMTVSLDNTAAEVQLSGGGVWQDIVLAPGDFQSGAGVARIDWNSIRELRLAAKDRLTEKVDGEDKVLVLGGEWKGAPPHFRNLRWVETDSP